MKNFYIRETNEKICGLPHKIHKILGPDSEVCQDPAGGQECQGQADEESRRDDQGDVDACPEHE